MVLLAVFAVMLGWMAQDYIRKRQEQNALTVVALTVALAIAMVTLHVSWQQGQKAAEHDARVEALLTQIRDAITQQPGGE